MYAQRFRSKVCRYHADDEPELGHFSIVKSEMRDAEILQAALKALEMPVHIDSDVRGSNGQLHQAEIVAVLEGKFDIGFVRAEDGTFNLVADLWGLSQKYDNTVLIQAIKHQYAALKEQAETKA